MAENETLNTNEERSLGQQIAETFGPGLQSAAGSMGGSPFASVPPENLQEMFNPPPYRAEPPIKVEPLFSTDPQGVVARGLNTIYGSESVFAKGLRRKDVVEKPITSGFGFVTERDVGSVLDMSRVVTDPQVNIRSVMPLDTANQQESFMSYTGVVDHEGQEYDFPEDSTLEDRVEIINKVGGMVLYDRDENNAVDYGSAQKLPWEKLIWQKTNLNLLALGSTYDMANYNTAVSEVEKAEGRSLTLEEKRDLQHTLMVLSLNYQDPKIGLPLYMDYLNEKMIKLGGSFSNPAIRANALDMHADKFLMGDAQKVLRGSGEVIVRDIIGLVGAGIGETIDALASLFGAERDGNSGLLIDIRAAENRQRLLDKFTITPVGYMIQDDMARRGMVIDYPEAEALAGYYTGLPERLFKLGLEIKGGGAISKVASTLRNAKTVQAFQIFASNRKSQNPELTTDQLLNEFVQQKADESKSILSKIKRVVIGDEAVNFLQFEDALSEVGDRAEVVSAVSYIRDLASRRDGLQARIARSSNISDQKELALINQAIDQEVVALIGATRIDGMPDDIYEAYDAIIAKNRALLGPPIPGGRGVAAALSPGTATKSGQVKSFRDMDSMNTYMIVGASIVGHVTQMVDTGGTPIDPTIGEFAGLVAGIVLNVAGGNMPAMLSGLNDLQKFKIAQGGGIPADFLKRMQGADPMLQQIAVSKANQIADMGRILIEEGVSPLQIEKSIASLTGLVGFKMIEDMTRYGLSVKKIKNFDFADLQMNLQRQQAFVADLRGVLMQISKDKNLAQSDVVGDFTRLLRSTIDGFDESIRLLESDVKLISEFGVQRFLDRIENGRYGSEGLDGIPAFMTTPYDEALERLAANRLINIADMNPTEIDVALNDVFELADQAVTNQSRFLSSVLIGQETARKAVEAVTGKQFGVKGSGKGTEADLANFNTPGALLAALSERAYAQDFTNATVGYRILDGKVTNQDGVLVPTTFYAGPNNVPVEGQATVDVTDVFLSMFSDTEISAREALDALRKAGMDQSKVAHMDELFKQLGRPFLNAKAAEGNETLAEFVNDTYAMMIEDLNKAPIKGMSKETQVLKFLLEDAVDNGLDPQSADILKMDFMQLRNFERGLSYMQSDLATKVATTAAASKTGVERLNGLDKVNTLVNITEGKFSQFELTGADGTRVPLAELKLRVKGEDGNYNFIEVSKYIEQQNLKYRLHKERWFGKPGARKEKGMDTVPYLMSWGNRMATVEADGRNPTGIMYNKHVDLWLDTKEMKRILEDSPDGMRLYLESWGQTLGEAVFDKQTNSTITAFKEGSSRTKAFQGVMEASILGFLKDSVLGVEGAMNPAQVAVLLKKMDSAFYMIDGRGNRKKLLDIGKAVDNLKFSRKSDGTEVYNRAMRENTEIIQKHIEDNLESAKQYKRDIEAAQDVIRTVQGVQNMSGPADVGKFIVQNGQYGYDQIRNALIKSRTDQYSKTKRTKTKDGVIIPVRVPDTVRKGIEQSIDEHLREMITLSVVRDSFRTTGRHMLNPTDAPNEGAATYERVIDLDNYIKGIGLGDEITGPVIERIVGERRYKVMKGIAGILSEFKDDPLMQGVQLNGVPSGLSIESYISRFYAIQRGVVRPQYIGTEAVIQSMRMRDFAFLQAALTNPVIGEGFLEVVRSGKPLSPKRIAQFNAAMLLETGRYEARYRQEKKRIVTTTGVEVDRTSYFTETLIPLPSQTQYLMDIESVTPSRTTPSGADVAPVELPKFVVGTTIE